MASPKKYKATGTTAWERATIRRDLKNTELFFQRSERSVLSIRHQNL